MIAMQCCLLVPVGSPGYYYSFCLKLFLPFHFSVCEGAKWVRKDKPCHQKCEWTQWNYGPCNASCDEAYRTGTRNRTYSNSYVKGQEVCPGEDKKVEKCDGLACCNSEQTRVNDKRCDITCNEVLNPPTNPAPGLYQSDACQNTCKCRQGYVLTNDRTKCVKDVTCGSCVVNGTTYTVSRIENYSNPWKFLKQN